MKSTHSATVQLAILPLVVIAAACAPSPELSAARTARDDARDRAGAAQAEVERIQGDLQSAQESLAQWQQQQDATRSEIEEVRAQIREMSRGVPALVQAAIENGEHVDLDPDLIGILIDEVADVLDPAVRDIQAIRASVTASTNDRFIPDQGLHEEIESILAPAYAEAVENDRQARRQRETQVAQLEQQRQARVVALKVKTPLQPVRLQIATEFTAQDLGDGTSRMFVQVDVHFDGLTGNPVSVGRGRSVRLRSQTLHQAAGLTEISRGRYNGLLELSCYLTADGYIEQSLIPRSSSLPALGPVNVAAAKATFMATAATIATGRALGQWAMPEAEADSQRDRINNVISVLIGYYEAHYDEIAAKCNERIERAAGNVPDALLTSWGRLAQAGTLTPGAANLSIEQVYNERTWRSGEAVGSLIDRCREQARDVAEKASLSLRADFESYRLVQEQVGSRLAGWQRALDLASLRSSEYQLPELLVVLPEPLQPESLIEPATQAVVAAAMRNEVFTSSIDKITDEARQLAVIAQQQFEMAEEAMKAYLDMGAAQAEVEAAKASGYADSEAGKQPRGAFEFKQREAFEDFLATMSWYPESEVHFHDGERAARGAARESVERSEVILEQILAEFPAGTSSAPMKGAMGELKKAGEALAQIDQLAAKAAVDLRLDDARQAARRKFLEESMLGYFERTVTRWDGSFERMAGELEELLAGASDPPRMVNVLRDASAAGTRALTTASATAEMKWQLSDDLRSTLQRSDLDSSWNEHLARCVAAAKDYEGRLNVLLKRWVRKFDRRAEDGVAQTVVRDSSALEWQRDIASSRKDKRASQTPPQLSAVQFAPHPKGGLVVCTWSAEGTASSSALSEVSALYLIGGHGMVKLLKLVQGPLAVTTTGGDRFEVIDLFGVEEWSGEVWPRRHRRYVSGYEPDGLPVDTDVTYNSTDRRDNSANRSVGGPMTERTAAALAAIGIPSSAGSGPAVTDAAQAAVKIREAWSKPSSLEVTEVNCEGLAAFGAFGARTTMGALQFSVPSAEPKNFLFTFASKDDPIALLAGRRDRSGKFNLDGFRFGAWIVVLGRGGLLTLPVSASELRSNKPSGALLSEGESRELFELLLKLHCFAGRGPYVGAGSRAGTERLRPDVKEMLLDLKGSDAAAFSVFTEHCRGYAGDPESFLPTRPGSYRSHIEEGLARLVGFIEGIDSQ